MKLCKVCQSPLKKVQKTYCSQSCAANCPERISKFKELYPRKQASEKRSKTNLEKFGVDNPFKDTKKMKEHYKNSLGVDNPAKLLSHRERMRQVQLTNNTSKIVTPKVWYERRKSPWYKIWLQTALVRGLSYEQIFIRTGIPISTIEGDVKRLELREFITRYRPYSAAEEQIIDFCVDELGIERNLIEQSKKGFFKHPQMEIDVFIKGLDVGVEYHGNYWHSTAVNNNVHRHVYKLENVDFRLIQIFEHEWKNKKTIVKDILRRALTPNAFEKKYARKLKLSTVSSVECNQFLEKNHIQGCRVSKVRLGLWENQTLLAVLCLQNKLGIWELTRYCELLGTHTIGGLQRLYKHFLQLYNPTKVISYCDRRYFVGNNYDKLGFKLDKITEPNYFYIDSNGKYLGPRYKFMKHKLKDIDPQLSEQEILRRRKIYRVYDAGNKKYIAEY